MKKIFYVTLYDGAKNYPAANTGVLPKWRAFEVPAEHPALTGGEIHLLDIGTVVPQFTDEGGTAYVFSTEFTEEQMIAHHLNR